MAQRSARARANAAFANWSGKQAIWAQCMQGEAEPVNRNETVGSRD
jgi:hypothetical protein